MKFTLICESSTDYASKNYVSFDEIKRIESSKELNYTAHKIRRAIKDNKDFVLTGPMFDSNTRIKLLRMLSKNVHNAEYETECIFVSQDYAVPTLDERWTNIIVPEMKETEADQE